MRAGADTVTAILPEPRLLPAWLHVWYRAVLCEPESRSAHCEFFAVVLTASFSQFDPDSNIRALMPPVPLSRRRPNGLRALTLHPAASRWGSAVMALFVTARHQSRISIA